MDQKRDGLLLSTEKDRINIEAVHRFLSQESYWAKNRSFDQTVVAIENSICFAVFDGERQVAFARVVSDKATFAYIGDVFVLAEYRGRGISKWMMEAMVAHPELQGLRRWILATADAHGLYEHFGFRGLQFPERWMERPATDAY